MTECKELLTILGDIETYGLRLADYLDQILALAQTCAEYGAKEPPDLLMVGVLSALFGLMMGALFSALLFSY